MGGKSEPVLVNVSKESSSVALVAVVMVGIPAPYGTRTTGSPWDEKGRMLFVRLAVFLA